MQPSSAKPSPDRKAAERRGRRAEALAVWFLRAKTYRIVQTRYKTPVGEIDIVARRGKTIVFVEVKQRTRSDQLGLADALGAVDTLRIVRAGEWFASRHPAYRDYDFRFDVIAIAPGRWPHHLVNAFWP